MRALKKFRFFIHEFDHVRRKYLFSAAFSDAAIQEPTAIKDPVSSFPKATIEFHLQELLKKCAREKSSVEGKAFHGKIIQLGLQLDVWISNILINMYSKCGDVSCARQVFDEMSVRSLVSWNTMIGSYIQNKNEQDDALKLFVKMRRETNEFSEFTVSGVVCACSSNSAISECTQLHAFAVKTATISNVFVGTALLDVYGKNGLIEEACHIFRLLPEKTDITWSSMISGLVQNELHEEALAFFHKTQILGLENNQFSLSAVISACAGLTALIEGKQIHAIIAKIGFSTNMYISSSLIDMYAKCGIIVEAYSIFTDANEKNVVLWNAIISGFSRHACSTEAMILFEKMQQTGISPNEVTYISIMTACGHKGLIENGRRYFNQMEKEHNILPNIYHYSCMVDILSRGGKVNEAKALIDEMPFVASASMWGSILASCRSQQGNNIELAELAAARLFEIEPDNAGNHVLLSNTYAANKKWEEVAKTRMGLKESEAKKERGKSWIEVKAKVHTFMVGERSHCRIVEIYERLEDLLEEMKKKGGYGIGAEHDLHDLEDNRKRELLRHHSEKLAFTFGLMSLPNGVAIRIMKNLRICGDCHSFMKMASKITEREIVVRDTNRFHHFKDGFCSCAEFW
ncbi:pentatricopeptide repeat-containing protein At5g04780, mitochondrial [Impatiens glandulifera]|uniref:pentatricopeptide repeat-containing protein At5g04780, mitochondrial n=1 Tax=Impatiens glandulifera TaxID=253017 RepID=UPI001FB199DD|nr:pentatricopeptide repeat-containing protein At5g04780, mitochondrial [Impatiens glandulifera]